MTTSRISFSKPLRGHDPETQLPALLMLCLRGVDNDDYFKGAASHLQLLCPQVQHDFNRNKFFDAQEAKDYGIVDQIIRPPRSQSLGV